MKCESRHSHVAAKATANDSNPGRVNEIQCGQVTFGFHTIPKRLSSLFTIGSVHEYWSISSATTVINRQNCIPVIHEKLHCPCITLPDLSHRAAMDPNQPRNFMLRAGIVRLPKQAWYVQSIKRLETKNVRLDQIFTSDLRIYIVGES